MLSPDSELVPGYHHADPNDMSVESVVAKETASSSAHKALTSPWASIVAVVIAVLWTVPTAGLLITSFRPEEGRRSTRS